MLDIFNDIARALALVSIFLVLVVTVKGPNDELASTSVGKSLSCNVTVASPVCAKKSGMTLLIFIMYSPSPFVLAPPSLVIEISKSPDSIFAAIAVSAPSLTWFNPVSCS